MQTTAKVNHLPTARCSCGHLPLWGHQLLLQLLSQIQEVQAHMTHQLHQEVCLLSICQAAVKA